MTSTLVAGCTIVPDGDLSPIYQFDRYFITRLTDDRWFLSFADTDLNTHFIERADELGFTDAQIYSGSRTGAWFTSPLVDNITGSLILISKLASDIIGAADAYIESWECYELDDM